MNTTVQITEWLKIIQKEYLQDFISKGGSAVKFVVPSDDLIASKMSSNIQNIAAAEGFTLLFVNSAQSQVHKVENLFFAVARQLDWDQLSFNYVRQLLETRYLVPAEKEEFNMAKIAELNGRDAREMRPDVNKLLTSHLFRKYSLTQEFRIAMLRLCQHQLDHETVSSELCERIKSWLRGEKIAIGALKPALIFQRIGRHNARHMLASLSQWLKTAGTNGLIIMLDISRYLQDRRPIEPDGTFYYSTAAVLDCYEVLRQFIDGTDESRYLFMLVIAPTQFLNPDDRKRGINAYDALKLRILDEVYDQVRANPLSSLVRVTD